MSGRAGLPSDKGSVGVATGFHCFHLFHRACSKKLWGNMEISRRTAAAVQTAFAANAVIVAHMRARGPTSARQRSVCVYFLFRQVLLAICASSPLACVAHPSIPICQQSQTTSAKNRLQFNLMMMINIYLAFNSLFFFFFGLISQQAELS